MPIQDTITNGASSNSITLPLTLTTSGTNRLILIFNASGNSGGGNTIASISGGGLSWFPLSQLQQNTSSSQVEECWAAFATSKVTSAAITVTYNSSNQSNSGVMISFSGIRTTGSSAESCITNLVRFSQVSSGSYSTTSTGRSKNGLIVYGVASPSASSITAGAGQTIAQSASNGTGATSRMTVITQNSANNRNDTVNISGTISASGSIALGAVEIISSDAGMVYRGMATNKRINIAGIGTSLQVGTLQGTSGNDMYEVPTGTKLIVLIALADTSVNANVTDVRGNAYTLVASKNISGARLEWWHCENVTTKLQNGDNITVSWGGGGSPFAIQVVAMYGLLTSNSIDSGTSNTGTSTTPSSGTTLTQAQNEIVIGVAIQSSSTSNALTPTAPFLTTTFDNSGLATSAPFVSYSYFEYISTPPPTSVGFSGTLATSATWGALVELYKENPNAINSTTTTSISDSSATVSGSISTPNGSTATGVLLTVNPADQNPTVGDPQATNYPVTLDGNGNFSQTFTNLDPGTTYYYGVYITDGSGNTTYQYGSFTLTAAIKKKRYYYKIYTPALVYLTTWSIDVVSDPAFRMIVNGGAGELKIHLARTFDSFDEGVSVAVNNRVELWCMDADAPNGIRIFTGYISAYAPTVDDENQYVDVTVLGYSTRLSSYILKDGATGNTTITYSNFDPSAVIQDAIDKFHNDGGNGVFYTATSIANTNTAMTYQFINSTIEEVINKAIQFTPYNWYWFIDANGILNMQMANIAYPDHKVTIGKDLSYLSSNKRVEGIVNAVEVIGGGLTPLFDYYERSASIASYGKWLSRIQDYRITDDDTSDRLAKRKLDQFQNPEYRTVMRITDNNGDNQLQGANIEAFYPGQTIQVINLANAPILIIQSIQYNKDFIEVEASTRLPEIALDLTNLNTNILTLGQAQLPVKPTTRSV